MNANEPIKNEIVNPDPAEWEYICVEVSRSESTNIYLKVPKGWRPTGRDSKMMGRAAKETILESEWDNFGWEYDLEVQGHKPATEKEAEMFRFFDARVYAAAQIESVRPETFNADPIVGAVLNGI